MKTWIRSPRFDLAWIISPMLLPPLMLMLFPELISEGQAEMSSASWVLLIMIVDVGHVYSTIYRTYLNKKARTEMRGSLMLIPFLAWIMGSILYSISSLLFWRVMAYIAVFHFIRQQYGIYRIYSRNMEESDFKRRLGEIVIYACTICPLLIWHFSGPRNFNWFVAGDFLYSPLPIAATIIKCILLCLLSAWIIMELFYWRKGISMNVPRMLLVAGTAVSWYIGIVVFNADLAFTSCNVLAHGIPYLALVWHAEKKNEHEKGSILSFVFRRYGIVLFLGLIWMLAFIEEGFWDALVWRDHQDLFGLFYIMPSVTRHDLLSLLVPLLTVPQLVHYIIDGYIWKLKGVKKGQLGFQPPAG